MKKTCKQSGAEFEVSEFERDFLRRIAPTFDGKKFEIPEPVLCPDERMRLRTMQRNEQYLFRNKSSKSGKDILSIYSDGTSGGQASPYKIFTHEEWWADDWDSMEFGRDYDFGRGFFEQFQELNLAVPRVNVVQVSNDNSPYTTGTGYCRNCHLINCSENCEDCIYGKLLQDCKDSIDCAFAYDSELLYGCFYVRDCYNCKYLSYSQNCSDCLFSENLRGCRNCFLCTNLTNKEYHFMNKPVSKEHYEKLVGDCLGSHEQTEKARGILADLRKKRVWKYANIVNCENCEGDFMIGCKECSDCYDMNDSEDCKYVQVGVECKDLLDCSNMYLKPELNYQMLGTIETNNVHFGVFVFHSNDVWYSQFCYSCSNLFGCVGLRNKEYCIFNKQYTKEEYERLVARIIASMIEKGEWGCFFPASSSPFAYGETVAHTYLPLRKEEALERGYKWRDEEVREVKEMDFEIPDRVEDVEEGFCERVLVCSKSGKNYKILPKELRFLKRMKMPVPRVCPDVRHDERMAMRNTFKLYGRECAKCGKGVKSTFAPSDSRVIYCEEDYQKEVA